MIVHYSALSKQRWNFDEFRWQYGNVAHNNHLSICHDLNIGIPRSPLFPVA